MALDDMYEVCIESSYGDSALLQTLDFVTSAYGMNEEALNHWSYYWFGCDADQLNDRGSDNE